MMSKDETWQKKIVAATLEPVLAGMCDPTPAVTVIFEDGEVKQLFSFYPDEISFTEIEFVGLTEHQARELRHEKDVAYLRS